MERSDSASSFRSCHSEDDSVSIAVGSYVCVTPPPVEEDGGSSSPLPLDSTSPQTPAPEPEPLVPERPSSRAETPRSYLLRRSGNKRRAPQPPTSPSPVPSVTGVAPYPVPSVTGVAPSPKPSVTGVAPSPVPSVTGVAPSPVPSVTGVAPSPVPSLTGGAPSSVPSVTGVVPSPVPLLTGVAPTPVTPVIGVVSSPVPQVTDVDPPTPVIEVTAPTSSPKAPPPPTVPSVKGVTPPTTIHMKLQDLPRALGIVTLPVDTPQFNTVTTIPCDVTQSAVHPSSSHASQLATGTTVAHIVQPTSGVVPSPAPSSVTPIGQHTVRSPPPTPQRKDSLYIATTMAHTNWNIRLIDEESDTETTDSFVKVKSNVQSPVFTNSASSSVSRQSVEKIPPMPTSAQPQNIIRPHPVVLSPQQATPAVNPQVPVNQTTSGIQPVIPNENDFGIQPVQPSAFQPIQSIQPIQLIQQLSQLPAEQLLQLAQLQQQAAYQQPLLSPQQVSQSAAPHVQSVPINSQSETLPKQYMTQENPARLFPELKIDENDDYYENTEFQSDSGISSPTDSMMSNSGHVIRGRARQARQQGLMHSASDPGIPKQCHSRSPPQHTRYPGKSDLNDLVEEEDTVNVDDTLDGFIKATRGRPRLRRSDSNVTVAHLYEDILVSHRLKCKVTLTNLTVVVLLGAFFCPNTAIMLYTIFRLVFGTLFPAYYSYKAVKTKNVKEYVKWMMYWIVFAFFTCFETITDLFLSFWFPFYYELKILVVLWLLSPATRGSSILYRKFVHPWLTKREEDIDDCIAKAKQQGYSTVLELGTKGVNYATTVLMQTAIKGGGGIVNQLRRSYSQGELNEGDLNRNVKQIQHIQDDDDVDGHYDSNSHISGTDEPRHLRTESDGGFKPRGSSASRVARNSGKTRSADVTEYYQDVSEDTGVRRRSPRTQDTGSRILSVEDLTSGYSSCDPDSGQPNHDYTHEHDQMYHNLDPIVEPKPKAKVRRTQSMNVHSTRVRRGAGTGSVLRSAEGGRGGGSRVIHASRDLETISDLDPTSKSYSSTGRHPAHIQQHGSSFRRSRTGEISAYATLPRTSKRTTTKKRQV